MEENELIRKLYDEINQLKRENKTNQHNKNPALKAFCLKQT